MRKNMKLIGLAVSLTCCAGFIDAQGRIVNTEFRKAYEHGGLFLFDEIDASFPQAILAFNAALANDFMDFQIKKYLSIKTSIVLQLLTLSELEQTDNMLVEIN